MVSCKTVVTTSWTRYSFNLFARSPQIMMPCQRRWHNIVISEGLNVIVWYLVGKHRWKKRNYMYLFILLPFFILWCKIMSRLLTVDNSVRCPIHLFPYKKTAADNFGTSRKKYGNFPWMKVHINWIEWKTLWQKEVLLFMGNVHFWHNVFESGLLQKN